MTVGEHVLEHSGTQQAEVNKPTLLEGYLNTKKLSRPSRIINYPHHKLLPQASCVHSDWFHAGPLSKVSSQSHQFQQLLWDRVLGSQGHCAVY